jgi:hypothetical protein
VSASAHCMYKLSSPPSSPTGRPSALQARSTYDSRPTSAKSARTTYRPSSAVSTISSTKDGKRPWSAAPTYGRPPSTNHTARQTLVTSAKSPHDWGGEGTTTRWRVKPSGSMLVSGFQVAGCAKCEPADGPIEE